MTEDLDARLKPRTSGAERAIGWVLMVGLLLAAVPASVLGLLLGMAGDGCMGDSSGCNSGQIEAGVVLASLGSPAVVLVTLGLLIKRTLRGQQIWWVPLVGAMLMVAVWVLGAVLAETAVT